MLSEGSANTDANRSSQQGSFDLYDSDCTDTEDAEDQFPMEFGGDHTGALVDDLEMNLHCTNADARSVLETNEHFIVVDDADGQSNVSTLGDLSISEDDILFLQETTNWELGEFSSFSLITHCQNK